MQQRRFALFFTVTLLLSATATIYAQQYQVRKTPASKALRADFVDDTSVSGYANGYFWALNRNNGASYLVDSLLQTCGALRLLRTSDGFWPMFDENGRATARLADGTCVVINTKAEVIKEFKGAMAISRRFVDGLAYVAVPAGTATYDVRYIDTDGNFIYPNLTGKGLMAGHFEVARVSPLVDGRRRFYDFAKERYGFIDQSGNVVIEPQFTAAHDFSDGLAAVSKSTEYNKLWGYVDRDGNYVISPVFHVEPDDFHDGYAIATKTNGKKVYFDKSGTVMSKEFDVAFRFFCGYAMANTENRFGPDLTHYHILDTTFKSVRQIDFMRDGATINYCEKNRTFSTPFRVYSPDGQLLFTTGFSPLRQPFDDEYALYSSNEIFGFIDRTGAFFIYFVKSEF